MKKLIILLFVLLNATVYSQDNETVNKAFIKYSEGKYEESIEILKSVLPELIEDEDYEELAYAYSGIGFNYQLIAEYDSSLKYSLICYKLEEKYDLMKFHSRTMHLLATLYSARGLNHEAIYYLSKAIEINKKNGNNKKLLLNYTNIGNSYCNIDFIDSSNYYYNLALEIPTDDLANKALIYNNLSSNKDIEKKFREADSLKDIALELIKESGDELSEYMFVTNKYILRDKYDKSDEEILNIFKYYYDISNDVKDQHYADSRYKLSMYYAERNQNDIAYEYLNEATATLIEFGNLLRAREITEAFLSVLQNVDNSKITHSVSDILYGEKHQLSNYIKSEIEIKIETEKIMDKLQKDIYYAELSNYTLFGILLAIFSISGFIFYKYTSDKRIRILLQNLRRISAIQQSGINSNLSKLTLFLSLCDEFREKEYISTMVDEVVEDANKISLSLQDEKMLNYSKGLKDATNTTAG